MSREVFEVTKERFHLLDPNLYILQGNWPKEAEMIALLDDVSLEITKTSVEMVSALERFKDPDLMLGERITANIVLPEKLEGYYKLRIFAELPEKKTLWFQISVEDLLKKRGKPQYYLEEEKVEQGNVKLRGWVVYGEPVSIQVYDEKKEPVSVEFQMTQRVDVDQMYEELPDPPKCGFFAEITGLSGRYFYIVFRSGKQKSVHVVWLNRMVILTKKINKYTNKGLRYLKNQGPAALAQKIVGKVKTMSTREIPYSKWITYHMPGPKELNKQKKTQFDLQPKISIVVPLYKTPEKYLLRLIECMKEQTYTNWELCLSDGSGKDSPLEQFLKKQQEEDDRIKVIHHEEALRIAENTNAAIEAATGEYIAFADHDDELTPNALFECVKAMNVNKGAVAFYSDEDKMSMDGHKFFQPHFKPDFNLDLLRTVNYICHLFVVRRDLLEQAGMLRKEYDGAQDYDFILRCIEIAGPERIVHIPKILYHWRCHEDSTAENPESKLYAFEAGKRALDEHYRRCGIDADAINGEFLGLYRTKYHRNTDPLISILIPNKDHIADLKRCMDSIDQNASYRNYEYVIVENNSTEEETFAFYKEIEKRDNVKVVYWKDVFNYAAINNFGAKYAEGEYLLLLNNDTEIINPDCLEEMLGYCMREDVGAVGARLYYEDDTIQHAGVVIGFGGIAGHCFVLQPRGTTGYCHRIICAQNYSAVTAACMMVKKKAFFEVGGLTEQLAVAFNDIDFCLKIRQAGYLIVYNPYAELYHYESKSRGLEDTPEKIARFNKEVQIFERRWPDILRNGDPYYNPNLTLKSQDFSLKRI